jgi:hypothetical protein
MRFAKAARLMMCAWHVEPMRTHQLADMGSALRQFLALSRRYILHATLSQDDRGRVVIHCPRCSDCAPAHIHTHIGGIDCPEELKLHTH